MVKSTQVTPEESTVRLDRWLWAARFYKSRALATAAVDGGKVQVNGARAKPAKSIKLGHEIKIRQGPYEYTVIVKSLLEKRVSAILAQQMYQETDKSIADREALKTVLKSQTVVFDHSRPNKKQRRLAVRHKRFSP